MPQNRLETLDSFEPVWRGSREEKESAAVGLLFRSRWRDKVPEWETPIDAALDEDALVECLQVGILSCEEYLRKYEDPPKAKETEYAGVFNITYPHLDYNYVRLLYGLFQRDEVLDLLLADSEYQSGADMRGKVSSIMAERLSERMQCVIIMRYGLDGGGEHSLEEISEALGASTARIREIERKARMRLLGPPWGRCLRYGVTLEQYEQKYSEQFQWFTREEFGRMQAEKYRRNVLELPLEQFRELPLVRLELPYSVLQQLKKHGMKCVGDVLDRMYPGTDAPFQHFEREGILDSLSIIEVDERLRLYKRGIAEFELERHKSIDEVLEDAYRDSKGTEGEVVKKVDAPVITNF